MRRSRRRFRAGEDRGAWHQCRPGAGTPHRAPSCMRNGRSRPELRSGCASCCPSTRSPSGRWPRGRARAMPSASRARTGTGTRRWPRALRSSSAIPRSSGRCARRSWCCSRAASDAARSGSRSADRSSTATSGCATVRGSSRRSPSPVTCAMRARSPRDCWGCNGRRARSCRSADSSTEPARRCGHSSRRSLAAPQATRARASPMPRSARGAGANGCGAWAAKPAGGSRR